MTAIPLNIAHTTPIAAHSFFFARTKQDKKGASWFLRQQDLTLATVGSLNVSNQTGGTAISPRITLTAYQVTDKLKGTRMNRYDRVRAGQAPTVPVVTSDHALGTNNPAVIPGSPSSSLLSSNQSCVRVHL